MRASGPASVPRPAVSEGRSPTGVLLAAGRGRRFGADKRWQPMADGTPMAVAAADALAAAVDEVVVVLRPEDRALAELMRGRGCRPVFAREAVRGMGHSLAAAVAATPNADGWLVALADMPWIRPDSHRAVAEALRRGASQARAWHCGRPGHPVGFAARWGKSLRALGGDRGARDVLDVGALVRCEVDDPGVLRDVDRPADVDPGTSSVARGSEGGRSAAS